MIEQHPWKGYLVVLNQDSLLIQSPYMYEETIVYGPDSDSTTMAIAGLQFMKQRGHEIDFVHLPDTIDAATVYLATSVDSMSRNDELDFDAVKWDFLDGDEATLVLSKTGLDSYDFDTPIGSEIIDSQFHMDIQEAWIRERAESNVSQGAYVSKSMYLEGALARLSLASQKSDEKLIWPPRQLDSSGQRIPSGTHSLTGEATVESWTKLSAAGAPSEFSLRAPILGGIQTVLVRFEQGPRGVFLVCDDVDYAPHIGDKVHFTVRRIYAQEGIIRYGLKALPLP
tara:strand:- start:1272 stop:2120 length:849 start_codon:yes stop_codon:yes gene_type:complete